MLLVTWWMNFPSMALAGLIRELSVRHGMDVSIVCQQGIPETRKKLGWKVPSFGGASLELLDRPSWRNTVQQILDRRPGGVHIFNGMGAYPKVDYAFRQAVSRKAKVGILSEAPVNQERGVRRLAKCLYIRLLPLKVSPYTRRSSFLLAVSSPDDPAFSKLGWPVERVFPFGYFSEIVPPDHLRVPDGEGALVRLVYFGQLTIHKGVEVLVSAASLLKQQGASFQLDIYGEGPLREVLREQITRLELHRVVRLQGAVPSDQVPVVLRASDILVAPGLVEPWGLTINEGIQSGLAVVVSDGVRGGSSLVRYGRCGAVVRAGDSRDLSRALYQLITNPARLLEMKERALRFARNIMPCAAAEYLEEILRHVAGNGSDRPRAPWLVSSE